MKPKHALNYNLEEDEIVDPPGNDGTASMPEQVKRSNPWRKMMIMMMKPCLSLEFKCSLYLPVFILPPTLYS
jgi:hypothetical protein